MKQKKNKDINSTIIEKESAPSVDKIDTIIVPENSSSKEANVIPAPTIAIAKAPIASNITKSKKLSLDAVDEDIKVIDGKEKTTTENKIDKEPIAINQDIFNEKWPIYINQVKTVNENIGLAMSLEQATCSIDFNKIIIAVNSETTKELVEKDKNNLISYLADELNNDTINVFISVSEQAQEMNKKSLSPNDKLKLMIDQNPAVGQLVQTLKLEIDY